MFIDQEFAAAADELRSQVDGIDPGDFRPNRSAMPAVLVLVLLLGFGALGFAVLDRSSDSDGVSVATQPEAPDTTEPNVPSVPVAEPGPTVQIEPTVQAADTIEAPALNPIQAAPDGSVQALTSAASGEYFTPIPGVAAWNADETKVLLYRTGSGSSHVIIDSASAASVPVEIDILPPDIEQVYWHPQRANELLFTSGANLLGVDTATGVTRTIHEFVDCDQVGSGTLPVAPAEDGTLSLLCISDSQQQLVLFDLASESERVRSGLIDLFSIDTAAMPSPSGDRLVLWNEDGTASVLDRELQDTGVVLHLDSNRFAFLTDSDGREWVVATLFDGELIGTAVVLPLDGASEPVVVIGPDRGDSYPPPGNLIAAAGSRVVIATDGPDDGQIAGRITMLDFAESITDPVRSSITHQSEARVDYWSNPFVALSPSATSVLYSSDAGADAIDTYLVSFLSQ